MPDLSPGRLAGLRVAVTGASGNVGTALDRFSLVSWSHRRDGAASNAKSAAESDKKQSTNKRSTIERPTLDSDGASTSASRSDERASRRSNASTTASPSSAAIDALCANNS